MVLGEEKRMSEKREGEKLMPEEEGIRKTICFKGDVKEIIEEYRREQKDIPSFTEAVNVLIKGAKSEK